MGQRLTRMGRLAIWLGSESNTKRADYNWSKAEIKKKIRPTERKRMSRAQRSFAFFSVVLSGVLASCLLPARADEKQANDYPLAGKVLASSSKGMHVYQVEAGNQIFLLLCEQVRGFHMRAPECKIDNRPIGIGDTVSFRLEFDWAYMPDGKGKEEGLRILTAELTAVPAPVQTEVESGKSSGPGDDRGIVIGMGMHIQGQDVGWSISPSAVNMAAKNAAAHASALAAARSSAPVLATGPVTAIPVTGGAPVVMMPTGPIGGGVVTGIPVTGGAPVVGIPTAPSMELGAKSADALNSRAPQWVHILRVKTDKKIYGLECNVKPCEVNKKTIELGDSFAIHTDKKWAYVSMGAASGGKDQKLRILSETDADVQ